MIIRRIAVPSTAIFFMLAGLFLSVGTVMVSATTAVADSRYVVPSAEVVLRSGTGTDYKVIGIIKDGEIVEYIEENGFYARVRLANGKEGWMLKRFLSTEPPLSTIVASLRAENDKLKEKELELTQKLSEVSANLNKTETNLHSTLSERNELTTDYQSLQQDTADVIKIKEDMLKATQQNEVLTQQITALKETDARLNKDKSIYWFMAGGGVLLVGMFLGKLSIKSRKRKSSLL